MKLLIWKIVLKIINYTNNCSAKSSWFLADNFPSFASSIILFTSFTFTFSVAGSFACAACAAGADAGRSDACGGVPFVSGSPFVSSDIADAGRVPFLSGSPFVSSDIADAGSFACAAAGDAAAACAFASAAGDAGDAAAGSFACAVACCDVVDCGLLYTYPSPRDLNAQLVCRLGR